MSEAGGRDGSRLTSVRNAARLLKELGSAEGELGVSELSRRLGLGKSTVHRLLATLTGERILEHNPATGTYRLGLVVYELGARVSMHRVLHDAATTVIEELRNATNETIQVAVLDGREVVYVERLESPHTLRLFGRIGHRMPAHSTSTGKVLLAFLPEERLDVLLKDWPLEPLTPQTITGQRQLREELARVRARGWAENLGESVAGVPRDIPRRPPGRGAGPGPVPGPPRPRPDPAPDRGPAPDDRGRGLRGPAPPGRAAAGGRGGRRRRLQARPHQPPDAGAARHRPARLRPGAGRQRPPRRRRGRPRPAAAAQGGGRDRDRAQGAAVEAALHRPRGAACSGRGRRRHGDHRLARARLAHQACRHHRGPRLQCRDGVGKLDAPVEHA